MNGKPASESSRSGKKLLPGLARKLGLARAALLWERLWPALMPAGLVLGLFLTLAFLDVLPRLGFWTHSLVLVVLSLAFFELLRRNLRGLALPRQEEAQRRLERDSGVPHRPLSALEDRPLAGGGTSEDRAAYWDLHRQRLLAGLQRLRLGWPRAGWSRRDSVGLRAVVGLPLVIALVTAGNAWWPRLERALVPGTPAPAESVPARLDAWISPPAYTGAAPHYLEGRSGEEQAGTLLSVPEGSRFLVQLQGGYGMPWLSLDDTELGELEERRDGVFRSEAELHEGGVLSIGRGREQLGDWTLEVVPDQPPWVEFLAAPARAARGAIHFRYRVADDYGVESLSAVIERRDAQGAGEQLQLSLPLPGRRGEAGQGEPAEAESFQDLTPHPWAGIAVTMTLEAVDAAGQSGRSEAFETVLPARTFNHPVARALADLRRELTLDPGARVPVSRGLDRLAERPDHYFNDLVVSLGIMSAAERLLLDRREAAVPEVQALLWDLALRIEEGEVAIAERRLRELQQELQEALQEDAPQEEVERLMNELQSALDQFLENLLDQAMEGLEDLPPQEQPPGGDNLERQDLQELIEQARELARSGAREEARELLAQLQRMLENLQAQPMQQNELNERLQESREMMQDLQEMMSRQQELLDRSFQRNQRGDMRGGEDGEAGREEEEGSPGRAPGTEGADARTQEELRRELGELMRRSGDMTGSIPSPLGSAEQAMRAARDALQQGSSGQALGPQGEALDHLQRGMEALLEDFAQQLGEGQGGEGSSFGRPGDEEMDPLGRRRGRGGYLESGEGVEIPEESALQRSREILNELRRRSSERERPEIELDYLERLLRQF